MTDARRADAQSSLRILIITHQLSRTGAPLMMLRYARWLVEHGHRVDVFALRAGPLAEEFSSVARVRRLPHWVTGFRHVPVEQVRRGLQEAALRTWIRLKFRDVDVVHANTITCGYVARTFAEMGFPVVSHIHELDSVARVEPLPARRAQIDASVAIVCVSEAVRDYVVRSLEVEPARSMSVVPSMSEAQLRRRSGARPGGGRFRVGGCGSLDWRKGSDLFLAVAYDLIVRRGVSDVEFVWLGGDHDSEDAQQRRDDLARLGLQDRVTFAPPIDDPAGNGWYEGLDAFLLTSREDPFPLVIHESASAGVPILGFAGCGGFDEFAAGGEAGVAVPFGDVTGMSDVLRAWIDDPESARQLADRAQAKWSERYDPELTASRLFAIDCDASAMDAAGQRR